MELLVTYAVDEGAEEAWQDVGDDEGGEEDGGAPVGHGLDEGPADDRRDVGEHGDEQLEAVEQDGVPRLSCRLSAGGRDGIGGEQHLEVGDDQGDAHHGQKEDLGGDAGEHNLSFILHSAVVLRNLFTSGSKRQLHCVRGTQPTAHSENPEHTDIGDPFIEGSPIPVHSEISVRCQAVTHLQLDSDPFWVPTHSLRTHC